jgi:lipoprotein-anchoring transpeptidase ErfK/SrfK
VVPTAVPTVAPTTTPAPVVVADGRLRVSVKAPLHNRGHKVALKGQKLIVKGVLRPAIRGQRIIVKLTHGRKTVMTRRARTHADGHFRIVLRARATGTLAVRAAHQRSRRITRAAAKPVRLQSFAPSLHFGSRGALLRLFQKGLKNLHFAAARTGVYDAATGRAVLAYRKVNNLSRTESTSAGIIRKVLAGKGGYKVKHPKAGHHVEADISRQILVLVDDDRVVRVEHVSSGKPSTPTVIGTFHFYSKTPGTNSHGMVYSNYFIRGYAIHGYADVPTYNASHGCLRIPIPDAIYVYNWVNLGDTIFVEY